MPSMMPPQPRCFHKVTHVIFDNDGTLMDSEDMYMRAAQNVIAPYGKVYTYELKMHNMGKAASELSATVVKELNLPLTPKEFQIKYEHEVQRLSIDIPLMPGIKDLLLHLYDHRVQMAVATSSSHEAFQRKARPHYNLMPVFRTIVCGDDPQLARSKPSPDIFLLAASRFRPRVRPECCLVIEDSPAGVQAAVAAGMQVVMIPDPRIPAEITRLATLVLRSAKEFQPELFGLPPFDNCERFTFG